MDFIKNEEPTTPEEVTQEGMGEGTAEPTEGETEAGETAPEETAEGQM